MAARMTPAREALARVTLGTVGAASRTEGALVELRVEVAQTGGDACVSMEG